MDESPTQPNNGTPTPFDRSNSRPVTGSTDPETAAAISEIEETRAEMSETIDAIQAKLSPAAVGAQARDKAREAALQQATRLRDAARSVSSTAVETAKPHTVPLAAAGAGVLTLAVGAGVLLARRRAPEPEPEPEPVLSPAALAQMQRTLTNIALQAQTAALQVAGNAQQRLPFRRAAAVEDVVPEVVPSAAALAQAQRALNLIAAQAQGTAARFAGTTQRLPWRQAPLEVVEETPPGTGLAGLLLNTRASVAEYVAAAGIASALALLRRRTATSE